MEVVTNYFIAKWIRKEILLKCERLYKSVKKCYFYPLRYLYYLF